MRILLIITLFFIACNSNTDQPILPSTKADSALKKSMKLNDSSLIVLDLADKTTQVAVKEVIVKVDKLESINNSLKNEVRNLKELTKITKTTIVRDTIYITEKKNFWGKTKTKIDSSSNTIISEDSTQNK